MGNATCSSSSIGLEPLRTGGQLPPHRLEPTSRVSPRAASLGQRSVSQLLADGRDRIKRGQYREGEDIFTRALSVDRTSVAALNGRGEARARRGHLAEAVEDLDEAVGIDEQSLFSRLLRGDVLTKMRQHEVALVDYDAAVRIDCESADARNRRGMCYHKLDRYEEGIADFTIALSLDPSLVEAYNNRGCSYRLIGRTDLALSDFEAALVLDGNNCFAFANKAVIMAEREEYAAAVACVSQALRCRHPNQAQLQEWRRRLQNSWDARVQSARTAPPLPPLPVPTVPSIALLPPPPHSRARAPPTSPAERPREETAERPELEHTVEVSPHPALAPAAPSRRGPRPAAAFSLHFNLGPEAASGDERAGEEDAPSVEGRPRGAPRRVKRPATQPERDASSSPRVVFPTASASSSTPPTDKRRSQTSQTWTFELEDSAGSMHSFTVVHETNGPPLTCRGTHSTRDTAGSPIVSLQHQPPVDPDVEVDVGPALASQRGAERIMSAINAQIAARDLIHRSRAAAPAPGPLPAPAPATATGSSSSFSFDSDA